MMTVVSELLVNLGGVLRFSRGRAAATGEGHSDNYRDGA